MAFRVFAELTDQLGNKHKLEESYDSFDEADDGCDEILRNNWFRDYDSLKIVDDNNEVVKEFNMEAEYDAKFYMLEAGYCEPYDVDW